jgi:Flp pilus assembly protein TadG
MNIKRMRGVYVVEFAIIGLLLFTLLFGVLEVGRLYFTVNALNETVRRGARLAAVCDISDPIILRRAIFNAATDSGASSLINNLATADLSLTYLDVNGAVVASPNDLAGVNGFRAIRYVQVRIANFSFNLLIPGFGGVFTLPAFRSTTPRESLGRNPAVVGDITPC